MERHAEVIFEICSHGPAVVEALSPDLVRYPEGNSDALDIRIGGLSTYILNFPRTNHYIDAFSGEGGWHADMSSRGFVGQRMDIRDGDLFDITSNAGIATTFKMVLSIIENGMLGGGPPCDMFTFAARKHNKRSNANPEGNLDHSKTVKANKLAAVWCSAIKIAACRGAFCWTEQPTNSLLFAMKCFEELRSWLLLKLGMAWYATSFLMGCYGWKSPKRTTLQGTHPHIKLIHRKKLPTGVATERLTKSYMKDGKRKTDGIKPIMRQSQEYTKEFCTHVSLTVLLVFAKLPSELQQRIVPKLPDFTSKDVKEAIEVLKSPCPSVLIRKAPIQGSTIGTALSRAAAKRVATQRTKKAARPFRKLDSANSSAGPVNRASSSSVSASTSAESVNPASSLIVPAANPIAKRPNKVGLLDEYFKVQNASEEKCQSSRKENS